ncbi:4Fe-4S dicluster domain-containing protein [Nibricoccus sp. IMCC34717]|uniref:4Fe-4S dicluster domain-containing protein n=1 Tax=Nibricoccus sp. IMCC34717 TaxID=3034021 RepID=UPI00384C6C26
MDPLGQSGRMVNLCLLAAAGSGVLLLFWYSSSLSEAHASVAAMSGSIVARTVRAVHRLSSDLTMAFLLLHALRMLAARKVGEARSVAWVSGVAMLGLVWSIGWTGYWLVWDSQAQGIATSTMAALDRLRVFGEPLGRLFLADRLVPSLLFFIVFFVHMLVPLLLAAGLLVHLSRLNRVRLLPSAKLSFAFLGVLLAVALLRPAPLGPPAAMASVPEWWTIDAWYAAPLQVVLRWRGADLWVVVLGTLVVAALLPLFFRRRVNTMPVGEGIPAPWQPRVDVSRCHACTQCVQDCPYDAIAMVPRTGDSRWELQAEVNPDKCVGCAVCVGSCDSEAMRLPLFDAVEREPGIISRALAGSEGGRRRAIALVAMDAIGGDVRWKDTDWERLLPGFQIARVPTGSWVRPKFVEQLARSGFERILIVVDGNAEANARDGNRWPLMRLSGKRKPAYRPSRAGGQSDVWQVLDFCPGDATFSARASAFLSAGRSEEAAPQSSWRWIPWGVHASAIILIVSWLGALTLRHPGPDQPRFVFSFKAFGAVHAEVAKAEEQRPVHMRGAITTKQRRADVKVFVSVNGVEIERSFEAKGLSHDGGASGMVDVALPTVGCPVEVRLDTGDEKKQYVWRGQVTGRPRSAQVLTFEPGSGFVLER